MAGSLKKRLKLENLEIWWSLGDGKKFEKTSKTGKSRNLTVLADGTTSETTPETETSGNLAVLAGGTKSETTSETGKSGNLAAHILKEIC